MKRFAFTLSLFTPIIFATDSFATDCPNLMTLIGASEAGEGFGYLSNDGEDSYDTDTYGITHNGEFVTDYGNKGKIHGYARCSTQDGIGMFNGASISSDVTTSASLPDTAGQYCYCQLDGYTPNGGSSVSLSTPWVFHYDVSNANECENACVSYCSTDLLGDESFNLIYRAAVFESVTCESDTPSSPARSPLRISQSTNNASSTELASGAYARGAYNANVANINNAIEYIEDSSVATINTAKVSANNVSLTVNGFTPAGTVTVDPQNAVISGTFNVPNKVNMLDTWGDTTTTSATLSGSRQVEITNGTVTGLTATFTGTASGDLSGTGSFTNAPVHVDSWRPVNPE